MLALFGALREELLGLEKRMMPKEAFTLSDYRLCRGKYEGKDVLLVQTGLGRDRAEKAAQLVLDHYTVTTVVSLGFAGALTEDLKAGDVVLCLTLYCANGWLQHRLKSEEFYSSDARLISLVSGTLAETNIGWHRGNSVTVAKLISHPEVKMALGKVFSADVVDMESYWIARITSARHIPFIALRAVSDVMKDKLPPFDQILDSRGSGQLKKLVPYFVGHPQHLKKLLTISQNTRQARRNLTMVVGCLMRNL